MNKEAEAGYPEKEPGLRLSVQRSAFLLHRGGGEDDDDALVGDAGGADDDALAVAQRDGVLEADLLVADLGGVNRERHVHVHVELANLYTRVAARVVERNRADE